jgi:hypothetical protein
MRKFSKLGLILLLLIVLGVSVWAVQSVMSYHRTGFSTASADMIPGARMYRQIRDVATSQTGRVRSSAKKGNLFEMTYLIDIENGIVTRNSVRRLDRPTASPDETVYRIVNRRYLLRSRAGEGGSTIIAINRETGEVLSLGDTFAFSTRGSDFAQVITGVYNRVY